MLRKNYIIQSFSFLMILFIGVFISSCSKDNEPAPVNPQEVQANKAIAKKWEVNSDSNRRLNGDAADFLWFEFTLEGYYIVLTSDLKTYTGTYTLNDKTITLDDYGVLKIIDVNENNLNFTFTAKGSSEIISIQTKVADKVIEASSKSGLLCKTWTVKRQHGTLYGMTYDITYPNVATIEYTVVFSEYGTYLLSIESSNGTKQILNRLWRWKDSAQSMICYGDVTSECSGENETTIMELNETSFKLYTVIASIDSELTDELVIFKK